MTKMTYGEQLKHPNWQRMRLEVLNRAGWKCEHCKSDDQTLHVHHKRYIKGHMAWEYELDNFLALCESCHAEYHEEREKLNVLLAALPATALPEMVSLLAGWMSLQLDPMIEVAVATDMYAVNVGYTARSLHRANYNVYQVSELGACLGFAEFDERLRALIRELHDKACGLDEGSDA